MTLNDLFESFAKFDQHGLVLDHVFMAGSQRFINVRLKDDLRVAYTADVTGDAPEIEEVLSAAVKKLRDRLAILDDRDSPKGKQAPMVMGDIQPYISQIDGSLIESRSKHRAHLKAHNCIEIGNETKHLFANKKPLESPPGLKDHIIRATDEAFRKQKRSH